MNQRTRRFFVQFGLSLLFLLVLLGHVGGLYQIGMVARLEAVVYDLRLRLFHAQGTDERIVIVDIDEKSLKEIGRWPWPRDITAQLTRNLFEQYGVAAVGYDIVFAEPDQSSGLPVLDKLARGPLAGEASFQGALRQLRPSLDYDAKLAEALATGPAVLGYYFNFAQPAEIVGQLPAPLLDCQTLAAQGIKPLSASGYNANLASLQAQATDAAFFNMEADFDGTARRMPIIMEQGGKCYGALGLLVTRAAMGAETLRLLPAAAGKPPILDLEGLPLPLDSKGMALVPYRSLSAFEYIPASDVIHGRAPAAGLEGRIVLLGSTAPGIMDLRVTPMSKVFPGVEIHANMISGILDGTVKWEPANLRGWETGGLLILGLGLAALLPFISPVWAAIAVAVVSGVLVAVNFHAWQAWNMSLPLAAPLLTVIGLFMLNMSYGFFVEARSKAQITRLFGQYVPPELVEEMAKDPARYSLRGESREMSVLFSDIVGFTSISEGLEASELADMLNVFLSHMTSLIQENRGTIDKYIGDAIMAFWGAPMSDERHARDAVLTALAMQSTLKELNPRLVERGWPEVRIGVGVNTGRMSVGNMGSQFRMAYTVMADAVNLASRLEGLTRQYGVWVLVGETTRDACPDITCMLVDRVRVKGKEKPVAIYEPLGPTAELRPEQLQSVRDFEAVLDDYQAQRWEAAEDKLRALRNKSPRKLYDMYLERIGHFRQSPPPADWDGVFTFTTK